MCATETHPSRCQTLQAEPQNGNNPAVAGCLVKPPWATPLRPRSRRRVLYPPLVRRHLPMERPDRARRWLLLLSALLFLQIYTEEVPCGAWEALQTDTATGTHHHQGSLQECEALIPMGELLQWGASVGEMDTADLCYELTGGLPTQALCA